MTPWTPPSPSLLRCRSRREGGMRTLHAKNPWDGAPIFYVRRTGSTMEEARRLILRRCPAGTVVVAGYQDAGRGRFTSRIWQSPRGASLLFTVIPGEGPSLPPQRLPLLAGLALTLCLEELFGLEPSVKWPNDVLLDGRKVSGILCEAVGRPGTESPVLTAGIGVNCNQRGFPADLAARAISLRQVLGKRVARLPILERFLHCFRACLQDEHWREKLRGRLQGLEREIVMKNAAVRLPDRGAGTLQTGSDLRDIRGIIVGLAEDGALLIDTRPGSGNPPVPVYAGEVAAAGADH